MSGLECCPACHPERSEGSGPTDAEILRFAQDDMRYLQMSRQFRGENRMPTYEYLCKTCSHRFEQWQKMTDEPLTICPECGGTIRRVLYPAGIVFKGSGFYKTDHHASGSVADLNGHAHKNGNEKAAESTDSGTSATSENKPTSTGEKSTGGSSAKSESKVASPTK